MRPIRKRVLVTGLTLTAAFVLTAAALGQPGLYTYGGWDVCSGLLRPQALEWVGDEIGLETAQKEKIEQFLLDSKKKTIELRRQAELARLDLAQALREAQPSESDVLKAATRVNDIQGKLQAERLRTLVRVKQVLKLEQIEKLQDLRRANRPRPGIEMGRGTWPGAPGPRNLPGPPPGP